jgi:hypothetical protein
MNYYECGTAELKQFLLPFSQAHTQAHSHFIHTCYRAQPKTFYITLSNTHTNTHTKHIHFIRQLLDPFSLLITLVLYSFFTDYDRIGRVKLFTFHFFLHIFYGEPSKYREVVEKSENGKS